MGRHSTGANTTDECKRIHLSYLLQHGILRRGASTSTVFNWNTGGSISIDTYMNEQEKWVRLQYTVNDFHTGQTHEYDYKIYLVDVPSNLGRGSVLYFRCPSSYRRCRILYLAYGSHIWKARAAYNDTIYYESQLQSKKYREIHQQIRIENKLDAIYERGFKRTYQGRQTRIAKRVYNLENQR